MICLLEEPPGLAKASAPSFGGGQLPVVSGFPFSGPTRGLLLYLETNSITALLCGLAGPAVDRMPVLFVWELVIDQRNWGLHTCMPCSPQGHNSKSCSCK